MSINIDGNAHALRQYEREQDRLQRMDDELEAVIEEIHDDAERCAQLIEDARPGLSEEEIIEEEARRIIEERRWDAREARADDDYYRLRGML